MRSLSLLAISALILGSATSFADDTLGKGGKGGGQSQPPVRGGGSSGGGQSQPPVKGGGGSGGGQSQPPVKGGGGSGGGQSQPPVRGGGSSGGGQSQTPVKGGGSGGGQSQPPVKGGGGSGGGQSQPPVRGGGGSGGDQSQPPVRGGGGSGGGQSQPPVRGGGGSGGGQSQPPVRGGGGSGGGQSQPPVRGGGGSGGGQSQPPVRGGGSSGGGQSQPPVRGGGSSGGNKQGSQPPVQRGGSNQGSNGGGVLLGGSRNNGGTQDISGRGQSQSSRSGRVHYDSNQNLNGRDRGNYNIPAAPKVGGTDAITREANREGNRISRNVGNYRQGYYQYNKTWNDNSFYYPYYRFEYQNNCYPSPWYYYPNLPGYVNSVRVQIGNFSFGWSQGDYYQWHYRGNSDGWNNGWGNDRYNSRDNRSYNRELDNAVEDIYDSFRQGNMRYIGSMIPSRGSILIEVDNSVSYRIGGDDFYDLMSDLIEGTYTTNYRVKSVRTWRGGATIEAEHEFRDPWGRTQRSYHAYGLQLGSRGYEIVAFRSQQYGW